MGCSRVFLGLNAYGNNMENDCAKFLALTWNFGRQLTANKWVIFSLNASFQCLTHREDAHFLRWYFAGACVGHLST